MMTFTIIMGVMLVIVTVAGTGIWKFAYGVSSVFDGLTDDDLE